jgi:hypothetical protein
VAARPPGNLDPGAKALTGTSRSVRSQERPGDGASPGVCASRRSPLSRRKNGRGHSPRPGRPGHRPESGSP